ncbi:MAG: hypothetical protein IT531_18520 [Burkholderiales bacterium]|nr:hypothetical protein [Burkholderiales bacterium]
MNLREVVGRRQSVEDWCAPTLVRRLAALLNVRGQFKPGDPLPEGWHVVLFAPTARQETLGTDGVAQDETLLPHPTPELPRKMLGGRRTVFHRPIRIGAEVLREGAVTAATPKVGRSGRLLVVTVRHSIFEVGQAEPAIVEEQDAIFREPAVAQTEAARKPQASLAPNPRPDLGRTLTFDTQMLFRYCAITFNAHRIHYDHPYATREEGYPALLVNGGYPALLLLEMLRARKTLNGRRVTARNLAPIYCGEPVTLCGEDRAGDWLLWAQSCGRRALEMTVA